MPYRYQNRSSPTASGVEESWSAKYVRPLGDLRHDGHTLEGPRRVVGLPGSMVSFPHIPCDAVVGKKMHRTHPRCCSPAYIKALELM